MRNGRDGTTVAFDVEKPHVPLFTFVNEEMVKGIEPRGQGEIFVLVERRVSPKHMGDRFRVFRPTADGQYKEGEPIDFPRDLLVVDLDPWSNYALLVTEMEEYRAQRAFLFDIATRKQVDLGTGDLGELMFLSEDILQTDGLKGNKQRR